ncbi:histidine phosphatase family protein [Hoeflea sp. YIM 152468]|uniref:SixA phosphatase family protein n=1 Tax=Hoeflea sp. YIM 152468 TaxID=3031759 RepID=UPI0023DB71A8|nr:histidine phosphatase family protein [Hoeflea sp. YIM 152468]MDF1607436.1 histidine phosphatase family protein [Hoeflea sp. YIM 152468]
MSPSPNTALRVYLVRHAHAAWPLPGVRDFDRGLDERGREEAARLAATLSVNAFEPDLVHCSSARRCRETLDLLLARAAYQPKVEHSEILYTTSHEGYLNLIAEVEDPAIRSVMLIGHNPMIEDASHALLRNEPSAYETALGGGFPTGGMLIADCDVQGRGAVNGDARFIALLSPVDA